MFNKIIHGIGIFCLATSPLIFLARPIFKSRHLIGPFASQIVIGAIILGLAYIARYLQQLADLQTMEYQATVNPNAEPSPAELSDALAKLDQPTTESSAE